MSGLSSPSLLTIQGMSVRPNSSSKFLRWVSLFISVSSWHPRSASTGFNLNLVCLYLLLGNLIFCFCFFYFFPDFNASCNLIQSSLACLMSCSCFFQCTNLWHGHIFSVSKFMDEGLLSTWSSDFDKSLYCPLIAGQWASLVKLRWCFQPKQNQDSLFLLEYCSLSD